MYKRDKRPFGSVLPARNNSEGLRIKLTYFGDDLRFPTGFPDTEENRKKMRDLLNKIYGQIQRNEFRFADTFPGASQEDKKKYTLLEGNDYSPQPSDLTIGAFARSWFKGWLETFEELDKKHDYASAMRRILPVFENCLFSNLNTSQIEYFLENLIVLRGKNKGGHTSKKRKKNVMYVFKRIWEAACGKYNWRLQDPFVSATKHIEELDKADKIKRSSKMTLKEILEAEKEYDPRQVLLLSEWNRVLSFIDPYYKPVTEFMVLTMMIASEIGGLPKACIEEDHIRVCVKLDKSGRVLPVLKTKSRLRNIPLTNKLRSIINIAMSQSDSEFLFTMKDGSPFDYSEYIRHIWSPALKKAGLEHHVGYSTRHTGIAWHLLVKVDHDRLIGITGHCDKGMIYRQYGKYRDGMYDEREEILSYIGKDLLRNGELNAFLVAGISSMRGNSETINKKAAMLNTEIFGDKFSDKKRLYSDSYQQYQ